MLSRNLGTFFEANLLHSDGVKYTAIITLDALIATKQDFITLTHNFEHVLTVYDARLELFTF